MLRIGEIRRNCRVPSFYDRGMGIFQNKRNMIQNVYSDLMDDQLYISAEIQGQDILPYKTELVFDLTDPKEEQIEAYRCTCPAFSNYMGMCKHCVALALLHRQQEAEADRKGISVEHTLSGAPGRMTSPGLSGMLASFHAVPVNAQAGIPRESVLLTPTLYKSKHTELHTDRGSWILGCEIGTRKPYVVKNLASLIHLVLNGGHHSYGKNLSFTHSREMFTEKSRQLLELLEREIREICPAVDSSAYEWSSRYRYLPLPEGTAERIMDLYMGEELLLDDFPTEVREGNPTLILTMTGEGEQGAEVKISALEELTRKYVLFRGTIYGITPEFQKQVLPFLRAMGAAKKSGGEVSAYLSRTDYRNFCGNLLPRLRPLVQFSTVHLDLTPYEPRKPEFLFYLGMDAMQNLTLRPQVQYGAAQYSLLRIQEGEYRAAEQEVPVRETVGEYFPLSDGAVLRCADEEGIYRFLREGVDRLRQFGEVLVEDSAKRAYIAPAPRVKVQVGLSEGLIDLNAQVENMPQEEMERLLNAYAKKKKFYRLSSGEFLSLEEGSLTVLSEIGQVLGSGNRTGDHARLPAYRAHYLNSLLTDPDSGVEVERTSDFKSLVRKVRDYRDSDYQVPPELQATLRGYQKIGFRWMCSLADCGLGGILADDMGLGKTVQTISLLLHRRGRSLIVCPASLVYNWAAELERFAPSLRAALVLGTAEARRGTMQEQADVFVTSYDLFRRDVALYETMTFDCCILDEAQYVRNAETKLAKAVKRIHSEVRFALTGTPIFNRLADLWSIFDYLLPGYLYSYPVFRERLEVPIGEGAGDASARLQRMTAPFVLRRRKNEVLKELPEKVESVQYVEMTPEQRKLYRAQEQQLRQSLQNTDETRFRQERIAFLAGLTRLRQLCCTPELYLEGYSGGSGKVDACMELLTEAAESEHKVLVFSQFTTMLDELCAQAKKRGLRFLLLTGKNSKEERRSMVSHFQKGEYDVFFISLKAGGTGLNLTAADRIIHFDPWWNGAAEDQATDRAHRIGQTRTVFVTRLVAKDTVEERILALQKKKRELSDQVLENAQASEATLSRENLLILLSGALEPA